MRKKVLYLESPAFGEPWKWGIERRYDCGVDLMKDVDGLLLGKPHLNEMIV